MITTTLAYDVALSHAGFTSAVLCRLVRALSSAEAVWHASDAALAPLLKPPQIERLQAARSRLDPEALLVAYPKLGIQIVSVRDDAYPEPLRQTHDRPFLLYVRGNLTCLSAEKSLAVVGTRRFTDYGRRAVEVLLEGVSSDAPCVVSGLAAGIDTLAHRAALTQGLPTVAVFGTAIDQVYPRTNERLAREILDAGGALMSEYPMGMPADKFTFPRRNRIIAGLSQGTLVIEGNARSGALITAKYALEENRQVLAVPGSIFNAASEGPNQLIQQGAYPIQTGADIAAALGWQGAPNVPVASNAKPQEPPSPPETLLAMLSPTERQVLAGVGHEPTSLEVIQAHVPHMAIMDLQTALTMLELHGVITALPGNRFCRDS